MNCPLCLSTNNQIVEEVEKFKAYLCSTCKLLFKDPAHFLSSKEEKKRYDLHENSLEDEDYLKFLQDLLKVVAPYIKEDMKILDFGNGPVKAYEHLLSSYKLEVMSWDPFYGDDEPLPEDKFDIIFCSEVFEHFYQPSRVIAQLIRSLNPLGILAVRTSFYDQVEASDWRSTISNWHYLKEDTHVSFYSWDTMLYLSQKYKLKVLYCDETKTLMQKREGQD